MGCFLKRKKSVAGLVEDAFDGSFQKKIIGYFLAAIDKPDYLYNLDPSNGYCFTFKQSWTMRVQINAVRFNADRSLLDFIEQKIAKLDTFHDNIISAEVFLKLDGSDTSKVKEKVVEVRLTIPGKELFIKEHDRTFESATDRVLDSLKDKLVRCKEKRADFFSPAIIQEKERIDTQALAEVDEDI